MGDKTKRELSTMYTSPYGNLAAARSFSSRLNTYGCLDNKTPLEIALEAEDRNTENQKIVLQLCSD